MARAQKQQRRKHRKEKKRHRFDSPLDLRFPRVPERPSNIKLLSYTITFEPLEHPEDKVEGVNEATEGIREQLFDDIQNNPDAAILVLRQLLERFPNAPLLMNWLSVALESKGDTQGAIEIVKQNFQANPRYLFARLTYANVRLAENDLDGVDQIVEKKFDLQLLYPDRDVFHISEFRAMSQLAITYWIRKGDFEAARKFFEVLEEVDPEGEATRRLRPVVEGSSLLQMARRLSDRLLHRGRLPGW
jgi:tetratricopeptide (TPR) repeat protein